MDSHVPTKWGIIGAGKISHDFVTALKVLPTFEHQVVSVAARKLEFAQDFASRHAIPKFCDSYHQLLKDKDLDIVYIGIINHQHFEVAKSAILEGKHVLCEKPLCINVKETKALVQLAREKSVFLMEGVWSRFFPAYKHVQQELQKGSIGKPLLVNACLGVPLANVDNCRLRTLGGGSLLNLGVYCVQLATLVFGLEKPKQIVATGHLNEDGVDESICITLMYTEGRMATLTSHMRVLLPNDAYVVGEQGTIRLPDMFVCPETIQTPTEVLHFPLPIPAEGSHFNYPNSIGLAYEAKEIRECLKNGLTESPSMRLDDSTLIAEIMETARKSVGVVYDQD